MIGCKLRLNLVYMIRDIYSQPKHGINNPQRAIDLPAARDQQRTIDKYR